MPGKRKRIPIPVIRGASQAFFFIIAVLGVFGVAMTGWIYPFFFCPASPGACAGCPIWVIEHGTLDILRGVQEGYYMLLYLVGLFLAIGVLVGRSFCGWACPVGSLQDIFSYFDRRIKGRRGLLFLSGLSLLMLIVGLVVPMFIKDKGVPFLVDRDNVEVVHYMWAGYIGAFGTFIGALSGVMFIKRSKNLLPSFILLGIGAIFFVMIVLAKALGLNNTPLASVELMGLLGLMFCVIGLLGIVRSFLAEKLPPFRNGSRLDWGMRLIKVGILVLIAPTSWFFDTLFFTDFDPIGGITATIPELMLDPTGWSGNQFFWYKGLFVVGVITLVAFVDRGWCRYLCPIGAMYGPTNKLSITDIEYTGKECIDCQLCIKACPMGVNPKEDKRDPECIRCGRCVTACPTSAQRFVLFNRSIRGVFKK
ncbi:MAG: 4Fe-4S binding protein [Candidatus Thermoplasmatota archaeon]|nr:4Fe-4S binding protein [Candidatus Thermoplasmatota archaeon]